jgi:hypothetical protein
MWFIYCAIDLHFLCLILLLLVFPNQEETRRELRAHTPSASFVGFSTSWSAQKINKNTVVITTIITITITITITILLLLLLPDSKLQWSYQLSMAKTNSRCCPVLPWVNGQVERTNRTLLNGKIAADTNRRLAVLLEQNHNCSAIINPLIWINLLCSTEAKQFPEEKRKVIKHFY